MTYMAGLEHDPQNEDLKDGLRRAADELKKVPSNDVANEVIERANADPELMTILNDPVILQLITECASNPPAAAAHLKNAGVAAATVQKLIDCGVIMM